MRPQAFNNRVPHPPETQPQMPHILKAANLHDSRTTGCRRSARLAGPGDSFRNLMYRSCPYSLCANMAQGRGRLLTTV